MTLGGDDDDKGVNVDGHSIVNKIVQMSGRFAAKIWQSLFSKVAFSVSCPSEYFHNKNMYFYFTPHLPSVMAFCFDKSHFGKVYKLLLLDLGFGCYIEQIFAVQ